MSADNKCVLLLVQFSENPPTTFGVFLTFQISLPGSTRSGENARKKSVPAFNPLASKIGFTNSVVVPGYVVDCKIINMSFRKIDLTNLAALSIYERSGVCALSKGVGTQIKIALQFARSSTLSVALKCRLLATALSRS